MYVHPAFKTGTAAALASAHDRGFGTLVAVDVGRPVAVHLPFTLTGDGASLECHVARANPIHEVIAWNPRVLLVCTGADAYVAPGWYASPNQVPTWNYVAVHLSGEARLMEAGELPGHLDRLSARFEAGVADPPWTPSAVDPDRMAMMRRAIVGIVVRIDAVEGQRKLGQHKGPSDHAGVVAGLRATGDGSALAIAELMDEARGG